MVFVTSNIPWCLLDNEYFIKALDMLRPGHPRLTSKNASTNVLSKLISETNYSSLSVLQNAKYITFTSDGLSDKTKKSISNWIIHECSILSQIVQAILCCT